MLIAVDFDGTVVEHAYPAVGEELPHAVEVLKELVEAGHQIILWTCRENHIADLERQPLQDAVDWFEERGIPLFGVNATPLSAEFRDFIEGETTIRKAFADIYIDDRNLGGFPGWLAVRAILLYPMTVADSDSDPVQCQQCSRETDVPETILTAKGWVYTGDIGWICAECARMEDDHDPEEES